MSRAGQLSLYAGLLLERIGSRAGSMMALPISRDLDKRLGSLTSSRSAQSIYSMLTIITYSIAMIFLGVTSANAEVPSVYRVYSYEYIHHEVVKFEREVWRDSLENFKNTLDGARETSNHYSSSERIDLLTFVSDSRILIAAHEYLLREGIYLVEQWRSSKPKARNKRLKSLERRVARVESEGERFQNLHSVIEVVQDELDSQVFTPEAFNPTGEFSLEVFGDQEKNLRLEYEKFDQDLDTLVKAEPYSVVSCFELMAESDQLLTDVKFLADLAHSIYIEFPRNICNYFGKVKDSPFDEFCRQSQLRFERYEELNLRTIELLKSRIDYFEFTLQKPRRSMSF